MDNSNKVIGIDLGTTNSAASVVIDGVPEMIPVREGRLLPSVVGISAANEVLVGTPARNQWVVSPERTIRSIKRKMGSDESVQMADKDYTPQEISAFILRELKAAAELRLGQTVTRAVITVPAYFNEVQRQATLEAGEIAGLNVERIINEPTAAALAYGYGMAEEQSLRMLVYDLGGGTFDVSIIELNYGVVDVLATAGDNLLGGDDFDELLAQTLADEFEDDHKIDLRQDHQAWARLLRAAEEAKIELSADPYAIVALEYIATDRKNRPLHLRREVSREEFEGLIDGLLERTISCIDQALSDAKLEAGQIDRVLLVGGSTRIPTVWEMVSQRMGQDPHSEIDPDAAVALGAAIQGAIVAGEEIDAILVDVTPLSLGIEIASLGMTGRIQADRFAPLIRRNATVPIHKSEIFTTMMPGQDTIHIKVYQGESPIASQNVFLGDFMVEELEPNRPDGLCNVTVNFDIDVNGILDVTVTERTSGKQVSERLKADRQRLSPEQVAESQAKLNATYSAMADSTIDLLHQDPGTHALLLRAERALQLPELNPKLAEDIRAVVDQINQAAMDEDDNLVEEYCDELIDLLFEAEE
ncbi:MAG: Hsp70 family protein [Caldilineaceae bacterium]|nr:Hsp70 family protein [Caldilineaceae bacterium]